MCVGSSGKRGGGGGGMQLLAAVNEYCVHGLQLRVQTVGILGLGFR